MANHILRFIVLNVKIIELRKTLNNLSKIPRIPGSVGNRFYDTTQLQKGYMTLSMSQPFLLSPGNPCCSVLSSVLISPLRVIQSSGPHSDPLIQLCQVLGSSGVTAERMRTQGKQGPEAWLTLPQCNQGPGCVHSSGVEPCSGWKRKASLVVLQFHHWPALLVSMALT